MFRSVSERPHRFAFLRRKWFIALASVLVVLGGIGGYVAYLYYSTQGDVQTEVPGVTPEPDSEKPFNVLLVGSDSREGLTLEEQQDYGAMEVGGQRADTIIIAHVDPETEHVTMVQFPRDLWVRDAAGGHSKINETFDLGRENLVNTIKELTGLNVNNYAEVNIAGFRDVVDAIGGVDICIPEPIPFDPQTGLEVKEPGMVTFDGERAVRFVRSRHFVTGDFERIQNQQKFLSAAIDKVTNPVTFLKFGTILELKRIAGDNVRIDANTSLLKLYDILKRFRSFDPDNYEAYTAPNLGVAAAGGGTISIVAPNPHAIKVMFKAIAANESPAAADGVPDIPPTEISVGVYNGTGISGEADSAAADLENAMKTEAGSVEIATITDAKRQDYAKSVVVYDEAKADSEEKAEVVAGAVKDAEIKAGNTATGVDVEVIVGKKFKTKAFAQLTPLPLPQPGELPEVCQ